MTATNNPDRGPTSPEPLVAVVTPFYNTEQYLKEAIESVLGQTYRNFEYLLVDNRSTDRSLAIARHYAALDPRIRVVTNTEFLDQDRNFSEAFRLIGPGAIYAKMVLADDRIFPRCLQEMVRVAERTASIGIVSGYRIKGAAVGGAGLDCDREVFNGKEIGRLHLQEPVFMFGSPSTVMFRAEVVRTTFPFYESGVPHADTEACYRTLKDWDFGFVHEVLSFTRVDEKSVSGQARDYRPDRLDKLIVVEKFGRDFLPNHEFDLVARRVSNAYFRMLGVAMLTRRDAGFWDYHRRGLATIGIPLRRSTLWGHALAAVARSLASPLRAAMATINANRSL